VAGGQLSVWRHDHIRPQLFQCLGADASDAEQITHRNEAPPLPFFDNPLC
jgi:hypothetical protein